MTDMTKYTHLEFQVVHNYGHGANGIALSWGTAVESADLTMQALRDDVSKL